MAKSAEEFAAELLVPVAAIGIIITGIIKCSEFVWKFVSENIGSIIVPLSWIVGSILLVFIVLKLISKHCPKLWKFLKITFFIMVALLAIVTILLIVFSRA